MMLNGRGRGGARVRAPRRVSLPVFHLITAQTSPATACTANAQNKTPLNFDTLLHMRNLSSYCNNANMPGIKQATSGKDDPGFDQTWNILAGAFSSIHRKNASSLSFEELFRHAYKLVLKKKHQDLYGNVAEFERAWLQTEVRTKVINHISSTLLAGVGAQSLDGQANERRLAGERFMACIKDAYADQSLSMNMITDVLMYMVCHPSDLQNSDTMLTETKGPSLLPARHYGSTPFHLHKGYGSLPLRSRQSQNRWQSRPHNCESSNRHNGWHDRYGTQRRDH
jgi:hypothetical protein